MSDVPLKEAVFEEFILFSTFIFIYTDIDLYQSQKSPLACLIQMTRIFPAIVSVVCSHLSLIYH